MHLNFTRQFDQMDCGPSCIRMVASAYGRTYPLSYLRTRSCLSREGVSVAGIRKCLGEIGMHHLHHKRSISKKISRGDTL
jgi:ATP-binding cassette subfamily B protein